MTNKRANKKRCATWEVNYGQTDIDVAPSCHKYYISVFFSKFNSNISHQGVDSRLQSGVKDFLFFIMIYVNFFGFLVYTM